MTQQAIAQLLLGAAAVVAAAALAYRLRLGLGAAIVRAAVRAAVQLTLVGLAIAVVFTHAPLSVLLIAAMLFAACRASGGRFAAIPGARRRAALAIGAPALGMTALLVVAGAFSVAPRELIPTAGILMGGAMTATTLTGRRLVEALHDAADLVETRLCLGDSARDALAPLVKQAVTAGLVPAIDQTRTAGVVTLPGTFVGLVLGGAAPATAARVQLTVLLALLLVELLAGILIAQLIVRACLLPGERVVRPDIPAPRRRPPILDRAARRLLPRKRLRQ